MSDFNLLEYCHEKNLKYKKVKLWLLLYFRNIQILNREQKEDRIIEIKMSIDHGERNQFAVETLPDKVKSLQFLDYLIKKEAKKKNYKKPEGFSISENRLVELKTKLATIEDEIFSLYKSQKSHNIDKINKLHLEKSLILIEKEHLEKIVGQIELDIQNIEKAENKLKQYNKVRNRLIQSIPVAKKDVSLETNKKDEASILKSPILTVPTPEISKVSKNIEVSEAVKPTKLKRTAEIPWRDITFGEKFIWFKYNRHFFNRYPMERSRIAFNQIKEIYNNRNLPPIQIEYSGRNVTSIINSDVLFYFFLFLENSGQEFKMINIPDIIKGYSHFTKSFYQKHLRQLFTPRCFNYLITICSDHVPIIPVPERVINSSGNETIDDSFLFPIRKNGYYLWIWESIEESKATYIFRTTSENYLDEIQNIYDFLTGELKNKRFSLIRSKGNLSIPLIKRIKHSDYHEWKYQVKLYTDR